MAHLSSKNPSACIPAWHPALPVIASLLCFSDAVAAPAPSQSATETETKPSRYIGGDTDAYLASIASRLAITKRATDPFGQIQDPAAKPAQTAVAKTPANRTPAVTAKPLNEVVKQIKVTAVMPAEGKFLVGTRSISRGDSFPLGFQGKHYRVEVVDVSAQRILFRDLETEEAGELRLDVMPQGMRRGIRGVLAPGMQSSKVDAPLEIDTPGSAR
jgi:hypothetical protein